jgi:serine/threonine protein kinase
LRFAHSTPGSYQQVCPGCRRPFVVTIPDEDGEILVELLSPKAPPRPKAKSASGPKPKRKSTARDINRTAVGPAVNEDDDDDFGVKADARSSAPPHRNGTPVKLAAVAPPEEEEKAEEDDFFMGAPRREEADEPPGDESSGPGDLPQRLGGYEVLRVLGKGGMGAVLLGRQVSLNRRVALKVMHPHIAENPTFVARFTREAYAAAQLTHHNIVQIYDIGEDKGQHFFSMEFVAGRSLMDLVHEQGRLAPEAAVGYILQAARGLRQGHRQGMVHRDIKPANLLVNDEGIVKVADLGLVKLPSDGKGPEAVLAGLASDDVELTGAGMAVGTPAFMAPEQATGSANVDARADIYSLGCTLYALVTGRPPFEGKTAPEVMSKHLFEPVIPPEMIVKRVPGALSAILMQMLAKEPIERYQTMDEVITALEGFLGLPRSGAFVPSEHETDRLEACANSYHAKASSAAKPWAILGFIAVCAAGVVTAAVLGRPIVAVKVFLLLCLTPPAYFFVHGSLNGGVVYGRVRSLVLGMRIFDWLVLAGGTALFLATLALFGLLLVWVKLLLLSLLLAFYLWVLIDKQRDEAKREPLRDGRLLCRALRGQGLSEDQLREFVCKYSGPYWEEFFEALFGYEAKLAARALRTGEIAGPWKPHAAWRDPIVAWADARLEARKRTREQKLLRKIEAKALEARGVSKAEAADRADDLAAVLVDQADEARKARKEGKEADLRGLVKAARTGKPKPGYNIAGKRLRDQWMRHFLNDWFGRRLRFLMSVFLLAASVYWIHQNGAFDTPIAKKSATEPPAKNPGEPAAKKSIVEPLVTQVTDGEVMLAVTTLSDPIGKPLSVPGLPAGLTSVVDSYRAPLTGFFLLVSAALFFGWRSSVPAVIGAVVAVAGPALGVPDIGVMSPPMLSLLAGTLLILVGSFLLRK